MQILQKFQKDFDRLKNKKEQEVNELELSIKGVILMSESVKQLQPVQESDVISLQCDIICFE